MVRWKDDAVADKSGQIEEMEDIMMSTTRDCKDVGRVGRAEGKEQEKEADVWATYNKKNKSSSDRDDDEYSAQRNEVGSMKASSRRGPDDCFSKSKKVSYTFTGETTRFVEPGG